MVGRPSSGPLGRTYVFDPRRRPPFASCTACRAVGHTRCGQRCGAPMSPGGQRHHARDLLPTVDGNTRALFDWGCAPLCMRAGRAHFRLRRTVLATTLKSWILSTSDRSGFARHWMLRRCLVCSACVSDACLHQLLRRRGDFPFLVAQDSLLNSEHRTIYLGHFLPPGEGIRFQVPNQIICTNTLIFIV